MEYQALLKRASDIEHFIDMECLAIAECERKIELREEGIEAKRIELREIYQRIEDEEK